MINPKAKSHLKNHSWPWLSFSRDILQNKNIFFDVECFPLANLEACVFDYSFVCICSHVLIAYLESFFAKWSWLLTFSNMPIFQNLADYYFFIAAQHLVPPYDIKKKIWVHIHFWFLKSRSGFQNIIIILFHNLTMSKQFSVYNA